MKKIFKSLALGGLALGTLAISPVTQAAEGDSGDVEAQAEVNPYADLDWVHPNPENSTITSDYGWRTIDGETEFHIGTDFRTKYCENYNCTVQATTSGTIDKIGQFSSGTYFIGILTDDEAPANTSNNLYTRYLHLEPYSEYVNQGDSVYRGQDIALSGTSGNVAPHLHFDVNNIETWDGGQLDEGNTVDPETFYPVTYSSSYSTSNSLDSSNSEVDNTSKSSDHVSHGEHNLSDEVFFPKK